MFEQSLVVECPSCKQATPVRLGQRPMPPSGTISGVSCEWCEREIEFAVIQTAFKRSLRHRGLVWGAILLLLLGLWASLVFCPVRVFTIDVESGEVLAKSELLWGGRPGAAEKIARPTPTGEMRRTRWEPRVEWLALLAVQSVVVLIGGALLTAARIRERGLLALDG